MRMDMKRNGYEQKTGDIKITSKWSERSTNSPKLSACVRLKNG